ncbi:MAG TPA: LLM class flavin-dependent oxidoreductase [Candidatus Nitrosotalea sp.]|nr:LLM class flavin-dependent oxidoreductase [Candidatus Nitrosotalea sp.]
MKIGLVAPLVGELSRTAVLELITHADELGYETVWLSEAYGEEVFTRLAEIACRTRRIGIASGIANVFARSPALIAQSAASLDIMSGGRLKLGLGTSGRTVVEGWHGIRFEHGIQRLRETIEIVRLVLARERVRYQGEIFQLGAGLRLTVPLPRTSVPIYLASLTPAGLELSGELADGWLPVFFSPAHFSHLQAPHLARGSQRSGRAPDQLRICVFQGVVVTSDLAWGRARARPQIAFYVGGMGSREHNYYNRLFADYGFGSEARRIQEHFLKGERQEAVAAVTDEMVDLVTIIGPPDECRRRLDQLAQMGVDEVALQIDLGAADAAGAAAALEALAPAA